MLYIDKNDEYLLQGTLCDNDDNYEFHFQNGMEKRKKNIYTTFV